MIVPMLALAGFLAEKKSRAGVGRHVPGDDAAVRRRCSIGVILIVGALTFFPALSLGPIVEHLLMSAGRLVLMMALTKRPLFDPPIVRRATRDAFVKLDPRHMVRNPVMFVVLVGSVLHDAGARRATSSAGRRRRLHAAARALALVHRAVRELRRSDGRRARQGAGGRRCARSRTQTHRQAADADPHDRTLDFERCPAPGCGAATSCSARRAT